MTDTDLNRILVPGDQDNENHYLEDFSTTSEDGSTHVYFRNLEQHIIKYIQEADIVVGCVAWLTSTKILQALAATKGVSIIVQKEDFLRPDLNPTKGWQRKLRTMYEQLPYTRERHGFEGVLLGNMSVATDPIVEPVRCVGNYNLDQSLAFPRSHHKFVVFCREHPAPNKWVYGTLVPYCVWTGSFNFTMNAARSLENALVLTDRRIVQAYYREWGQIAAISERLDWTATWVEPQWRIGT